MPVPDFQSLMLPALKALADGSEARISEVRARVAAAEGLTPEDLRELVPSGQQSVFTNRVSWSVIHMTRAGLVERVRRAVYRLTPQGERLLSRAPTRIDMQTLRESPAYVEWLGRTKAQSPSDSAPSAPDDSRDTPEEALSRAAQELRAALEADVLGRVREAAPAFLESVVIDLLIAMGYGGGDARMGHVTGRSGDGGIDGTIREDALGLDEVYVQAKKYAEGNTMPTVPSRCSVSLSPYRSYAATVSQPTACESNGKPVRYDDREGQLLVRVSVVHPPVPGLDAVGLRLLALCRRR